MRTFDNEIQLISIVEGVNDRGFPIEERVAKPPILVNLLSVRSQEFWAAKQEGVNLAHMFEVHSLEYEGEEFLLFEGNEHRIERTYNKGDYTELLCSRKSDDHA